MKRKLLAGIISAGLIWNSSALALDIPPDILNEIQQHGTARIIVELDVPWQPEGLLRTAEAVVAQRQQLTDTQQQFVTTLSQDLVNSGLFDEVNSADGTPIVKPETTYETIPYLVLEVSDATLPLVQQQTLTKGVTLDHADEPSLTQSLPLIGADKAWSAGYTGQGQQIAVLDTGVEKTHPFFATNRVVQEACFSATLCPDGQKQQVSAGAAVPCSYDAPNCLHGTHVAGIAASVAKDAQLIAVQVFSKQLGTAKSLQSDQLAALDWLQRTYGNPDSKLAAVNLSLGGGKFASACDDDPRKKAIDNLRSVGIATIVSSGNQGYSDGINAPACISSAISVGATDKADSLWTSSNSSPLLQLLAPGVDIVSSVTGGGTLAKSGTSMAAPHVAGAWAVLKAAKPTATVDELLTTLQGTGKAVSGKGVTKARVQLDKGLSLPVATATDCDAVKDGLVACYPFDGNTNDESQNGHPGIEHGISYVDGVQGKAAEFSEGDYVDLGQMAFLSKTSFSISLWVKKYVEGQMFGYIGKWNSIPLLDNSFGLSEGYGNDYPAFCIQTDDNSYKCVASSVKLEKDRFAHIVAIWDNSSGMKMYMDRQLVSSNNFGIGKNLKNETYSYTAKAGSWGVLRSGQYSFKGLLDDLRVYNRALSEDEIKQLAPKVTLTVAKVGNGNVTTTNVNCGTDCTEEFPLNELVTLNANAMAGSIFKGWTGDCGGTGARISVTMDKARTCTATFEQGVTDCSMMKEGLVACYTFEDNANDDSGNGNHGIEHSITYVGGVHGKAAEFGEGDYVDLGQMGFLSKTQFSISFWVKKYEEGQMFGYIGKWNSTEFLDNSFYLGDAYGNDHPSFYIKADDNSYKGSVSSVKLEKDRFAHIVAIWDNSSGMKMYMDGQLVLSNNFGVGKSLKNETYSYTAKAGSGGVLRSGRYNFKGLLDDLRIYNRALSEAEVKQLAGVVEPAKVTLTVTKTGNGQVTGNGITCGTDCTEDLAPNTQVTLTATPTSSTIFQSWTGDCTGTTSPLTVTMDKAKTCGATFEPLPTGLPLTVNKADDERGRITGRLRGATTASLTCTSACPTASYNYPKDGVVIVTATAEKGFEFKTWTCTGSSYTQDPAKPNILKVTMTTETTCTANFDAIPGQLFSLTVNLIGTGMGSVTPSKAGLECQGSQCTGVYAKDTRVTLTAKPNAFSNFLNWGGDCTGNSLKVSVTLTKDLICSVQFQSMLEAAATELVEVLYTDGFLENNTDVASQFSQATNQDRLKEAFWLAATAILQADANLTATQQWPAQLNDIPWYSKNPIGQYTESIQFQADDYVDIRLKLLDNAGVEQEAMIVIYYGDTPPIPVGDSSSGRIMIPIYVPSSWLRAWNSRPR